MSLFALPIVFPAGVSWPWLWLWFRRWGWLRRLWSSLAFASLTVIASAVYRLAGMAYSALTIPCMGKNGYPFDTCCSGLSVGHGLKKFAKLVGVVVDFVSAKKNPESLPVHLCHRTDQSSIHTYPKPLAGTRSARTIVSDLLSGRRPAQSGGQPVRPPPCAFGDQHSR